MGNRAGEAVELRLDATLAQLPLVRTMAAAVAMRQDYDIDSIADLRLVVDEACGLLLARALPFSTLVVQFDPTPTEVRVRCSVSVLNETPLARSGLGWRLISTLVDTVSTAVFDGEVFAELVIDLCMARRAAVA
ncbi:serine/threonine-protein kinase RsbW [Actinokineospora auranticolor]|uniref:Serine/threonine-protein kinase RsbW n=2 Tax=Actinokineospora auranticolor TaxID=155976 RepID=A0A2S6H0A7_9PSEU|nr:serine/threonine-protein kinase RsbW [Actinokineospora auranticolor]